MTTPLKPTREAVLDPARPLWALTASTHGMQGRSFAKVAPQAFAELMAAVGGAGLAPQVRSWLAMSPDEPLGPDDPECRYLAGAVFGHDLATDQGTCTRPELPLTGSLAWTPIAAGRYVVFTHLGPYEQLHRSWRAIYDGWLPFSGEHPRTAPALELCINTLATAPPDKLHTEIWVPLHRR